LFVSLEGKGKKDLKKTKEGVSGRNKGYWKERF